MALIEDMFKGNLLTAAAVGATALVLPRVLPELPAPVRSVVKSGLSLFLDAESDAEGGIADRMADTTLKNVLGSLSGPGSAEERQTAAGSAVEDFKRTSHARAHRYGRDDRDRAARYGRNVAALHRALDHERARSTGAKANALQELSAALDRA